MFECEKWALYKTTSKQMSLGRKLFQEAPLLISKGSSKTRLRIQLWKTSFGAVTCYRQQEGKQSEGGVIHAHPHTWACVGEDGI